MPGSELFKNSRLKPIALPPVATLPSPPMLAALAPVGGAPPSYQLLLAMQQQAESLWCWAAVTVSVSSFYSPASKWTQCFLVSAEVGSPSCCTNGSSSVCNQAWTLDTALQRTNNLVRWAPGTVPAAGIQTELGVAHPICCRIGWNNGGGHFVALSGYQNDGVIEEVTVDDPFYGRSHVPLGLFMTAYQNNGVWTDSFYTAP
jgi:hypothetical protein